MLWMVCCVGAAEGVLDSAAGTGLVTRMSRSNTAQASDIVLAMNALAADSAKPAASTTSAAASAARRAHMSPQFQRRRLSGDGVDDLKVAPPADVPPLTKQGSAGRAAGEVCQ